MGGGKRGAGSQPARNGGGSVMPRLGRLGAGPTLRCIALAVEARGGENGGAAPRRAGNGGGSVIPRLGRRGAGPTLRCIALAVEASGRISSASAAAPGGRPPLAPNAAGRARAGG